MPVIIAKIIPKNKPPMVNKEPVKPVIIVNMPPSILMLFSSETIKLSEIYIINAQAIIPVIIGKKNSRKD